jgi:hypothetical protein
MDNVQNLYSYIIKKLAPTSPTSVGCSVGVVRSWTQTTEFFMYINIPSSQTYRWARSGDVMCFLWGTDKPMELSWVLNKRQDDG